MRSTVGSYIVVSRSHCLSGRCLFFFFSFFFSFFSVFLLGATSWTGDAIDVQHAESIMLDDDDDDDGGVDVEDAVACQQRLFNCRDMLILASVQALVQILTRT